jgi:NAD(P)-dependent dehydrogenase (short-subunit alcohol dehydrogenase family)
MRDFSGKVAFITGGGSGIGLGTAQAFLQAGMRVTLADLRQDHLDSALDTLHSGGWGSRVHAVCVDVTDRSALSKAAEECEATLGPLHVVVNNAGVGVEGPLLEATFADWDFGLGVNLGGVINGLQILVPKIRRHGRGGYLVNTSSVAAFVSMPPQLAIYATAKAAVVALSEAIRPALETESIGVSVLCPGPTHSNIHEINRNVPERHAMSAAFSAAGNRLAQRPASPLWMSPREVGDRVLCGMRNDQLYIITHGEWRDLARKRFETLLDAMTMETNPALLTSMR